MKRATRQRLTPDLPPLVEVPDLLPGPESRQQQRQRAEEEHNTEPDAERSTEPEHPG